MLCAEANDSIVALDFTELGLQKIFGISGRNELTGTYGRCTDDLLIKKPLRKCRVLGNLFETNYSASEELSRGLILKEDLNFRPKI